MQALFVLNRFSHPTFRKFIMQRPCFAALAALLLIITTGCTTTSPFVGKWNAVSGPAELEEEVGQATLTLDIDGYALAQASEEADGGGEGIAIEADWEQETDNRMRVEFAFDDEPITIVGWLTGPDTMTATIIAGEQQEAVTVELERVEPAE